VQQQPLGDALLMEKVSLMARQDNDLITISHVHTAYRALLTSRLPTVALGALKLLPHVLAVPQPRNLSCCQPFSFLIQWLS
jgi:hypothetical protein